MISERRTVGGASVWKLLHIVRNRPHIKVGLRLCGGRDAVDQWLESATNNRGSWVRFPLAPLGNVGNFIYPTLPVSFGRDTKTCWSLLSAVYARGSKRAHTGGKCVTCRGLHNSTWSIFSTCG